MLDFASSADREEPSGMAQDNQLAPRSPARRPEPRRADIGEASLTEVLGDVAAWFEETERHRKNPVRRQVSRPAVARNVAPDAPCGAQVDALAASMGDVGALLEETGWRKRYHAGDFGQKQGRSAA